MDRSELAGWLRLSLTPGVGNDGARRLLAAFGLPEAVFAASPEALEQVGSPAVRSVACAPSTAHPSKAATVQQTALNFVLVALCMFPPTGGQFGRMPSGARRGA